ncbi:MAG: hypothetical protein U1E62_23180 [Alsobacter sp.]
MSEPRDMVIPVLQEIGAAIASRDGRPERFGAETRGEFARPDARRKALRQATGTDTLMSKFILGDCEERLAPVEQTLERLSPSAAP